MHEVGVPFDVLLHYLHLPPLIPHQPQAVPVSLLRPRGHVVTLSSAVRRWCLRTNPSPTQGLFGWGPKVGGPKFRFFFSPLPIFALLSSSEGLLVEFWWSRLSKTSPKFHEKTPRERDKKERSFGWFGGGRRADRRRGVRRRGVLPREVLRRTNTRFKHSRSKAATAKAEAKKQSSNSKAATAKQQQQSSNSKAATAKQQQQSSNSKAATAKQQQ